MTVRNQLKPSVAIFAVDDASKFTPRSGVYERARSFVRGAARAFGFAYQNIESRSRGQ